MDELAFSLPCHPLQHRPPNTRSTHVCAAAKITFQQNVLALFSFLSSFSPTFVLASVPSPTYISTFARLRQRAAHDLSGRRGGAGGSDGRLDGDLRAVLRERPDSSVAEVLYVPPSARTGIVALTPLSNPLVGHLVLARLGTGMVELVNLAVVTLQVHC